MPLKIVTRADTGALTIAGTIKLPGGARVRVRRRAQSDVRPLAEEEAAALAAQILRDAWHGERPGHRSFAEAARSYLKAAEHSTGDKRRIGRIQLALGDVALAAITQEAVDRVREKLLGPHPSPATVRRGIITPIRAILMHAHRRGWCPRPSFEVPREAAGRTNYLLPAEAERLCAAAAPHLRPLIAFLLCTGARLAEALELEWREVDLAGSRATMWTKGRPRRRRVVALQPRALIELAALPHRDGLVFRWETRRPSKIRADGTLKRDGKPKRSAAYADRNREGGGQIASGWRAALKRAGLAGFTPHDLRHSWASWHYALHKDLIRLQEDGQWSQKSLDITRRYTHLLPAGHEAAIRAFWGVVAETDAARIERA